MLSHLRVVEFASVLAGPAVGMFFAELGASVLKIENKATGGDMTRGWKLPSESPENPSSAYYASVNWGKTSVFLDLDDENDRQIAWQAVQEADILLANFKPDAALRFGLDPDACCAANPRLIYAQIRAFPDPNDPRPAFDMVMQAETGFLYMNGEPGRSPVKMPVALIDILAAHQLKEAILLALLRRQSNGGQGSRVSVSLYEAALASLANQATNWLMAGQVPQPLGSRHPNIAPYGDYFACADGKSVVLAVGTERQWRSLCTVLGATGMATFPEFTDNAARVRHRDGLNRRLEQLFLQKERDTWLSACAEKGVPAAAIRTLDEVFSVPEAQEMVLHGTTADGQPTRAVRTAAFRMAENISAFPQ